MTDRFAAPAQHSKRRWWWLGIVVLVLVLVAAAIWYWRYRQPVVVTSSTTVTTDNRSRAAITVDTQGKRVNVVSVRAQVTPPSAAESLSLEASICNSQLMVSRDIDPATGNVEISCMIPDGYRGDVGEVFAVFGPADSPPQLHLLDKPEIFAHDGRGSAVNVETAL